MKAMEKATFLLAIVAAILGTMYVVTEDAAGADPTIDDLVESYKFVQIKDDQDNLVYAMVVTCKEDVPSELNAEWKLENESFSINGVFITDNEKKAAFEIGTEMPAPGTYELTVTGYDGTYPVKVLDYFTVSYDANGGDGAMAGEVFEEGSDAKLARNGFKAPKAMLFVGWALSPTDKTTVKVIEKISEDVTVYAIWRTIEPSDMSTTTVSDEASTTETVFSEIQIVSVKDSWTLLEGADITINGELNVPAGATLTLQPGSKLVVNGKAIIGGSLVIEDSSVEDVDDAMAELNGETQVKGMVDVQGGKLYIGGALVIAENAAMVIEDAAEAKADGPGSVEVEKGGSLIINGSIGFEKVKNAGSVTINSMVVPAANTTIFMAAPGAIVDIQNYTDKEGEFILTVTDLEMMIGKNRVANGLQNTVSISVKATAGLGTISGLEIKESVENAKPVMSVSGTVTVSAYADDVTPKGTGGVAFLGHSCIAVTESIVAGDGVNVSNSGKLKVTGTLEANDVDNSDTVDVEGNGLIKLRTIGIEKKTVNATKYVTTEDKAKIFNYASFDSAVAKLNEEGSAVKEITVLGKQTATTSAMIPADASVAVTGMLFIGKENGSDVKLELPSGAKLKGNGQVHVMGTLYAFNKNDVKISSASIFSDVYSVQMENGKPVKNGWAKWTNVFTAMSEAQAGDVVEVTRDGADKLEITKNTTIPAGVTLKIATGKAPLFLKDGVTLTVDGVLDTYPDVFAEKMFGTTAMNGKSSAVVVNGLLKASKLSYGDSEAVDSGAAMSDGAPVAGVYFETDGRYAISALSVALGMIKDVTTNLTAYGPVISGDDTFTATEKCTTLIVSNLSVMDMNGKSVASKLIVGTLTLSGSKLDVTGAFVGSIMIGDSAIVAENVKEFQAEDDNGVIRISGEPVLADKIGDFTVSMGTVKANTLTASLKITVSAGATLLVVSATLDNLVIDGTVSVTGQLDSKKTTVNAGGKFVVSGIANVAVFNVGIAGSTYIGAEATVSGPVTVTGQAFVAPGAVIDAVTQEKLDTLKSTAYYVEEKLLMTVYDATGTFEIAEVSKIFVPNAYFDGTWKDSKGMIIASGETIGSCDKVYANVVYEIYKIVIKADQGVDDVYLNGMQMSKGMITIGSYSYYAFFTTVKAGEYTVTYNLANGYAGEAKLYANGVAQSGNKFTAAGTPVDSTGITMEFQLSGIQKSGYVDPTEPEKKVEGLTITEILLIVLVVLVVIMAVIVALRLMRS